MTEEQARFLRNDRTFVFYLYHDIQKSGYLWENPKNKQWYIVHPQDRDKPVDERGYPVRLDQIEDTQEIDPHKPSAVSVTGYPLPAGFKASKLVILGAGASFDFCFESDYSKEPVPLTKDLFQDRFNETLKHYPGAFDLSSEIALLDTEMFSIEDYFQDQWKKVERTRNPQLLSKLINTQYYLHDLFFELSQKNFRKKLNNYVNFIKLAHEYCSVNTHEHIPIITFNYDLLLEEACQRIAGIDFSNIDGYVNYDQNQILVFKPHGSCNWIRRLKKGLVNEGLLSRGENSVKVLASHFHRESSTLLRISRFLSDDIQVYSGPNKNFKNFQMDDHGYFPTMMIPYKDKDDDLLPARHSSAMKYLMRTVSDILIIGWRGQEKVFQDTLKNEIGDRKVKITIVDPDHKTCERTRERFSELMPNATFHMFDGSSNIALKNFSDYMRFALNTRQHFFEA
jgi:hypothetical protein